MHGSSVATLNPRSTQRANFECLVENATSETLDMSSPALKAKDIEDVIPVKEAKPHEHDLNYVKNNDVIGSVNSIQTFTTSDGPGIRTLVFLQGCAKRCMYCSNPETQCITFPDSCDEVSKSDKDIVNIVQRYENYLRPHNGGITMSGGEPLLQPRFVRKVFEQVKNDLGMTTCLDTSGHGNVEIWDQVLPVTDYVMLCLKAMDLELAEKISGVPKSATLRAQEFARHIRDNYSDKIRLSIRWVLLKGMTDSDEELNALASFVHELQPVFTHVELLPYHDLGKEKYEDLQMPYPLEGMEPYSYDDAIEVKRTLSKKGIKVILAGP
jgi:pyruvate formate lyase activating enzyme